MGDILKKVFLEAENYFADVSFDIGGKSIYAHQVMLAARSELFRKMFQDKLCERKGAAQEAEPMQATDNMKGKEKEKEKGEKEWVPGEMEYPTCEEEELSEAEPTEVLRFAEEELKALILGHKKPKQKKLRKGERAKKDFTVDAFGRFLEYCYSDRLDVKGGPSNQLFQEIKVLAKKHSMKRLVAVCKRDRVNLPASDLHQHLEAYVNNPAFSDVVCSPSSAA